MSIWRREDGGSDSKVVKMREKIIFQISFDIKFKISRLLNIQSSSFVRHFRTVVADTSSIISVSENPFLHILVY